MKVYFKYLLITAAMAIFLVPYITTHAATKDDRQNITAKSKYTKQNRASQKTLTKKRQVRRSKSDKLVILNIMPVSGKARETGFDGKVSMETTTILDSDFTLCAKATRGLIMIDNDLLSKCGGRPTGWAKGPGTAKKRDHSKRKK